MKTLNFGSVRILCTAGCLLILTIANAWAGQNIIIDKPVSHAVYGNGLGQDGGTPPDGDPNDNTVSVISGGDVGGFVYGGYSNSVNVTGNSVTISGGVVQGAVNGGYGNPTPGIVAGNSVTISGGEVRKGVNGGFSNVGSNVTGNSVTISGGVVSEFDVVGGNNSGAGNVTDNSVTISGGEVSWSVYGSWCVNGNATGNSVTISGGKVGGSVDGGNLVGGSSVYGNATDNRVTINGGEVEGDVYGGRVTAGNGKATGNTVTISGSPTFGATTLSGGTSASDPFTDNTLNVWNYTGSSVVGVLNFEFYNFVLPTSKQGLTVTGAAYVGNSQVSGVSIMGGGIAPQAGDSLTLIHAGGGFNGTIANDGFFIPGKKGAMLDIRFQLDQQTNDLYAKVDSAKLYPQTKSLSEGRLGGVATLNHTGDLVARRARWTGNGAFFDLAGNWSQYKTGSHVDVKGLSLITGMTRSTKLPAGQRLTYGAFFEYGNGGYDTFNSFSNAASVRGNGTTNHYGGGLLGRLDFANCWYADASLRAGGLRNEYRTSDLLDAMGNPADYDANSAYFSSHLGLGTVRHVTKTCSLDLYGRYFWTHQQGNSVTLATDDPVQFAAVNSHRLRAGARFSRYSGALTPYIGAAYEYELDGEARATSYGYTLDAPSLRGSTGIGEIGLSWQPGHCWYIDLGAQGYIGTREGATASLLVGRRF